jgi:hypothetical protein
VSMNIVGWVAVEHCCRIDPQYPRQGVTIENWSIILHTLDEARREIVHQHSLPWIHIAPEPRFDRLLHSSALDPPLRLN